MLTIVDFMVSVATIQLCCCIVTVAIGDMQMNK